MDDRPASEQRTAAYERQSHVRHEMRAPLSVMYPLVSVLLDGRAGELTPQQREYLQILERNVTRLEGMIASAMDSGWLDCAAATRELTAVPLAAAVEDLLAVRRMGTPSDPRIEMRLEPGAEAVAWADPGWVRQIVADLLDNAVHFTPSAGTVRVVLTAGASVDPPAGERAAGTDSAGLDLPVAAPARVTIQISDDGCGMTADELERAFEFGFRGAAAKELGVPGMGLGLWVCRELAVALGGGIHLRSTRGEGTTVTVVLPAAAGGL